MDGDSFDDMFLDYLETDDELENAFLRVISDHTSVSSVQYGSRRGRSRNLSRDHAEGDAKPFSSNDMPVLIHICLGHKRIVNDYFCANAFECERSCSLEFTMQ